MQLVGVRDARTWWGVVWVVKCRGYRGIVVIVVVATVVVTVVVIVVVVAVVVTVVVVVVVVTVVWHLGVKGVVMALVNAALNAQ